VDSVRDLARRFPDAHLVPTTVARVPALDMLAGARLHVALESLQVTGSFKVRGALAALAHARDTHGDSVRVVAASAGNHGAGVAYAAQILGVHAVVVTPSTAPAAKRSRITAYGAELLTTASPHYDDAEAKALALAGEQGMVFISPYDDPFVAAGNGGSLAFDIVRALGRAPDCVICPFGGGGLASGLAWGLEIAWREGGGRGDVPRVWGAQSEASPAMALSLERGRAVNRLESSGTLAEGLEGGISDAGFERARATTAGVMVVDEGAIAHAMRYAKQELGLVIEGSAATALVPVLTELPTAVRAERDAGDAVVVVVLTGRNVDS
jgi:threonine dehydratase